MDNKNNKLINNDIKELLDNSNVIDVDVTDEVKKSFVSYAMSVNVARAIPDVRDGLKPVHRRILYTMYEMGLTCDKPYKKCAKIVGEVLGKFHPHGDTSVYDALVRLAQNFSINIPLIDGHGNFGSVDGDEPAAYRYTEARLSKLSNEMLYDIDKDTVDFYPNYDNTETQPYVLPSKFPNILVNGSNGIAVGIATNIPPHNLNECLDACIALLENNDLTIDKLMNYIKAPDYPTGGILMNPDTLHKIYKNGHGSVAVRAKTNIETNNTNGKQKIIITELPYQVNKAQLIKDIADLVKNKKIQGISDINDESDRSGMRIVIDVKKDFNANVLLNKLYKTTSLQKNNVVMLLCLVDGKPTVLNLKEILTHYLNHQKNVIKRKTKFDLIHASKKYEILIGLLIALKNIDEVISIIKESKNTNAIITQLNNRFNLNDAQSNAILDIKLNKLASFEISKLNKEKSDLYALIENYKHVLSDDNNINKIIKEYMIQLKNKYNTPRKTQISFEKSDIDITDIINNEDIVISLSKYGYLKRINVSEYKTQNRGGKGVICQKLLEEDIIKDILITSTHSDVFLFSNQGKLYTLKAYNIQDAQKISKGRSIMNFLQLKTNEYIETINCISNINSKHIIIVTKKGLIEKISIDKYNKVNKKGKRIIRLKDNDSIVFAGFCQDNDLIAVYSYNGKCAIFNSNDLRISQNYSYGAKCIKLANDDDCVAGVTIADDKTKELLTITEHGFCKKTNINEYRILAHKGGVGVNACKCSEKTGNLISIQAVEDCNYDLFLITDSGMTIRTNLNNISTYSKNTLGVKTMDTNGAKIKKAILIKM